MTVEGIAEVKGQSNSPVYGLELKLIGYGEKDKRLGEQHLKIAPYKLTPNIPVPFHLSVPLRGDEVDFGLWVYYWFYPTYGGAGPKTSRISYITDTWYWTYRDICPKDEER